MIIYPAIDIKDGKCVRLKQGDFSQVTEFNDDVLAQAQEFERRGFKWLHVVDLDGARQGRPLNFQLVENVIRNTSLNVQIGGGIRDFNSISKMISYGASRVILGTAAIENFELVEQACKEYPGQIAVGVDARGNKVATHGWQEEADDMFVFDLIAKLEKVGVSAIIYTDVSRDGLLSGFDEQGTEEIAKDITIPIIASGGVSTIEDLKKISAMKQYGVEGAIVGRAFYEDKLSFSDALTFQQI